VIRALSALLANAVDPMVRNPQRAVALAERAVSLTGREDGAALDLLAVALARAGRIPEALATTREALVVARRQGDAALVANLERRLAVVEGSGAVPAVQP
jgi:Flp pilus assembly protein TadD